jgi:hypothetical protein
MNIYDDINEVWENNLTDYDISEHSNWNTPDNHDRWVKLGNLYLEQLNYFLDRHKVKVDKTIAEFGSGGGCNGRLLCKNFPYYLPIDISEYNLNELIKQMEIYNNSNYLPIHYDV